MVFAFGTTLCPVQIQSEVAHRLPAQRLQTSTLLTSTGHSAREDSNRSTRRPPKNDSYGGEGSREGGGGVGEKGGERVPLDRRIQRQRYNDAKRHQGANAEKTTEVLYCTAGRNQRGKKRNGEIVRSSGNSGRKVIQTTHDQVTPYR